MRHDGVLSSAEASQEAPAPLRAPTTTLPSPRPVSERPEREEPRGSPMSDPFAPASPPPAAPAPEGAYSARTASDDEGEYFGHTNRLPARADGRMPSEFFDNVKLPSAGADFVTDELIAEWRRFGLEVEMEHPKLGRFFLVTDHTDEDRAEMTWEMLKQILTVKETFPEMNLAGLRRRKGD